MLAKLILKKIVPSLVALAVLVLGAMWLYGFIGVKAGFVGPLDIHGLNAISRSGAEAAGGVGAATKARLGL